MKLTKDDLLKGWFVLYFVEDASLEESNFVVSTSKLLAKICFADHMGLDHDEPIRVRKVLDIPTDEPMWEEWDMKLSVAGNEYAWKGQYTVPDETLIRWGMQQLSEYTFTYKGRTFQQGLTFRQIERIYKRRQPPAM